MTTPLPHDSNALSAGALLGFVPRHPIETPSAAQEYDKRARNSAGKLYMPSHKFGLEFKNPGSDATHGNSAKTKPEAIEKAQLWCAYTVGRSATVYRRCDPVCKPLIHYWNDGKMQFIEYK